MLLFILLMAVLKVVKIRVSLFPKAPIAIIEGPAISPMIKAYSIIVDPFILLNFLLLFIFYTLSYANNSNA